MSKELKDWKIGIAYERYGYINVKGKTREEAIENANKTLEKMSLEEMEKVTDYLPDSEEVDVEIVEEIK